MKPLSPKHQRFVAEYLVDQDLGAAYRRAGYSPKNDHAATNCGSRLYARPDIRAAIDEGMKPLLALTRMTAIDAWTRITWLADSDIGDIIDFSGVEPKLKPANEIPEWARKTIKSVKVKRYVEGEGDAARTVELMEFTFWDKPSALFAILKGHGELADKLHHSGSVAAAVEPLTDEDKVKLCEAIAAKCIAIRETAEGFYANDETSDSVVGGDAPEGAALCDPGVPENHGGDAHASGSPVVEP